MTGSKNPPAALPAPRFAFGWAALLYVLAAVTLAYPALFGGFLVSPISDQYIGGFPVREFAASMIRETGGFPLWNPYIFGGLPYVAAMHGDIFYPTFLLRTFLPTDVAMTWSFVLHFFLAGLFTYLFLRAWGLGFLASLIGGLAYMMGGPIASYVSPGHDGKLYVSALYPLVLLLIVRGVRSGRMWSFGLLALVSGLAVLSPHPQLLQYMLLSAGAFALFVAFAAQDGVRLKRGVAWRRLGLAAMALVVGFAMGAIQYVPVLEYIDWSPRAGGLRGYERATSYSFPPEELISTVLPQFSGILDSYWGRNGIHFHSEYLGVAVLVLAGLAFGGDALRHRKGFVWFWLSTGVVALLWALGGFTPFYRLVYAIVPGTKFFRAPSTIIFVAGFAIAVLAAIGVERALTHDIRQRYLIGWSVAGVLFFLLAVSGGLTGLATSIAPAERYDAVLTNANNLRWGGARSLVFLLAIAAALAALAQRKLSATPGAWILAAIIAVDLWSVERLYWRFSPPAERLYASDPTIEYIKRQDQPGRVLALPLVDPGRDPFFAGDALMVHDIRQVLGYHGNEIGRYDVLTGRDEGYAPLLDRQLWRLLNVRYVLTNAPGDVIPGARLAAGPVKNAAGSTIFLHDLRQDNPLAWITPLIVKAPDEAVLATVRDPRFDPATAALFEPGAPVQARENVTSLPPPLPIKARTTHYAPGRITVHLDAPAPPGSALVVSENYYPGWRASADGRPAAIGRSDYSLIGVALPPGARTIALSFHSRPYELGKTITLAALALALLGAIGGAIIDRRRRA